MQYGTRPASLNLRDFAGEDEGPNGFVKMYSGTLEACVPAFAQVFKHIRDQPDNPVVFHCSGKPIIPQVAVTLRGRLLHQSGVDNR